MILKGIPASPGIVIGRAFLFDKEEITVPHKKISEADIPLEIVRFEDALIKTRAEILDIQNKIQKEMGANHAEIFNAHLLVLEDRMLIEQVISQLKETRVSVEYIFLDVLKKYIRVFSKVDDEYIKERISDINDIGKRILKNLLGTTQKTLKDLQEQVIVVSYDLSPSDTASMHKDKVIGFITDIGGRTSHTAIMARSLEIPAVVGLESVTKQVATGDLLIVDGTIGVVEVNPSEEIVDKYKQRISKLKQFEDTLVGLKDLDCVTPDNRRVDLVANIELPNEVSSVKSHGASGIGLYRTEYLFMNRTDLPTEEEQYQAYKNVAEAMNPLSVVIRTLDLGGDKFLSQFEGPHEMNPFMGWRAIRFCLGRPDIFKTQLKAILRANLHGNLKLMYPMISGVEEVRAANLLLEESKEELYNAHVKFKDDIDVGVMIEIPSAAMTCDIIAKEVKFFSIGTNDLIQYALAVDRINEKVAYLYEPAHPAVIRFIKNIVDAGHRNNIWVGMCGEMAGEPEFTLLLLGLGLDELSTSPASIPKLKKIIRTIMYKKAKEIVEHAMKLSTGFEVESFVRQQAKLLVPELFQVK